MAKRMLLVWRLFQKLTNKNRKMIQRLKKKRGSDASSNPFAWALPILDIKLAQNCGSQQDCTQHQQHGSALISQWWKAPQQQKS